MIRSPFIILSLLCISATLSCADEGAGLKFQTNCYFPVGSHESLHMQTGKDAYTEVDLPRMQFSETYHHQGSRNLVFGTITKTDDQPVFTTEATVVVPKHIRNAFLIFLPTPKNSRLPFTIHVLDASLDQFTPGSAVYYNFSQKTIVGKLGDRKLQLRPQSTQMVKGNPGGSYQVDIRYLKDKKWRPLIKSTWEDDPDFRQIILIFDNPQTRRTRFLPISSRVLKEEGP